MARIRTIKPEFWTDPGMVALPHTVRLLYIGLWNFADDYGCLEDEPLRLKLQIMPADDVDVPAALDALVAAGRLSRLESADGEPFLHIRSWERHQKVDKRSRPKFGEPDTWRERSHIPQHPAEPPRVPPNPAEPSEENPLEGKGREGKGNNPPSAPPSGDASSRKRSDRATRIPDDWRPDPEPELVAAIGGQQPAAREFAKFVDHWKAKPGKDGRKVDWQATWRNWLRNSQDFKRTSLNGGHRPIEFDEHGVGKGVM